MSGPVALPAAAALAFAVCWASLALALRSRWALRVLDLPNARSLHEVPVPRIGGPAVALGVAAATVVCAPLLGGPLRVALAAAAALAVVSWIDDVRGLPAAPRFVAHLAAAAAWSWTAGVPPAWVPVAALAIGWATNLYNFMDGADGLAGGMSVFGFGAYAAAFAIGGDPGGAALAAAVAAAAAAFLRFNAPPARVFLGDSGSIPLGFLAAALGLHGWREGCWTAVFPLVAFLPFWFDATATLALRIRRGARPWEAHTEHFYQKAVRGGLGHRGTALREWALMAACSCLALVTLRVKPGAQALILVGTLSAAIVVASTVERRARKS